MTSDEQLLLGLRIREAIKNSKFSQKELAEQLGISENGIGNYVKGVRVPDALLLYRIAQMCDSPVEWLLSGKISEKGDSEINLSKEEREIIQLLRDNPETTVKILNFMRDLNKARNSFNDIFFTLNK